MLRNETFACLIIGKIARDYGVIPDVTYEQRKYSTYGKHPFITDICIFLDGSKVMEMEVSTDLITSWEGMAYNCNQVTKSFGKHVLEDDS